MTPILDNAPWYRHRWPWLLMLGPATVIVAGAVTVWLAVTSNDGLVSDDYYKRGLAINQTIERSARAQSLGLVAIVDIAPNGVAQVALESASAEADASPQVLHLLLAHPTRAGSDVQATLRRTAQGRYAGAIAPPAPGRWRLIVESDRWRLPAAAIDGAIEGIVMRASGP
jgi:hypothetical protein